MEAIVFLSDLKASKQKEGREAIGEHLRDSLRNISDRFDQHLITPFDIQRGIDEFGGIIEPTAPSGEILLELWKTLHPHPARFSLVRGRLDVVPETNDPSIHEFDGPAFHSASDALDTMDTKGKLVSMRIARRPVDPVLVDMVNLLYFRLLDWTPHQLELYEAYTDLGSQAKVADHFGISQPTVSESLRNVRTAFMETAFEHMTERVHERFGGSS